MNTGQVLGGALRLARRRAVLGLGMILALIGLVYAGLYTGLILYNPNALSELTDTLTTHLPPYTPAWALGGALLLLLGGLLSEGGLILAAGRRALEPPAAGRRVAGAWRRLPALLAVGGLVWWPVVLGLLVTLAPIAYWAGTTQDSSGTWGAILLSSGCCAGLLFLGGWLLLWPQQRLANCALLLDGLRPRAAVRTARRLFYGRFGPLAGLWLALLLLNAGLLLVSLLLAGLAAAVVAGLWSALVGSETVALAVAAGAAVILGGLLLLWDGVVSAFNLNTWVLTYLQLRPAPAGTTLGTTQILGRQRVEW